MTRFSVPEGTKSGWWCLGIGPGGDENILGATFFKQNLLVFDLHNRRLGRLSFIKIQNIRLCTSELPRKYCLIFQTVHMLRLSIVMLYVTVSMAPSPIHTRHSVYELRLNFRQRKTVCCDPPIPLNTLNPLNCVAGIRSGVFWKTRSLPLPRM